MTASQDRLETVPSGRTTTPMMCRVTPVPGCLTVEYGFDDALADLELDVCE